MPINNLHTKLCVSTAYLLHKTLYINIFYGQGEIGIEMGFNKSFLRIETLANLTFATEIMLKAKALCM